ncbi:hypothetical protein C8Q72DRAFT_942747 [Fomitopsis betulina]|nr:hypothetical protein C8Q72DRAFT_942747 [Fomitopsis betulina]
MSFTYSALGVAEVLSSFTISSLVASQESSEQRKVFEIVCNNYSDLNFSVYSAVDGRRFPRGSCIRALTCRQIRVEDGIDGFKPLLFSSIAITVGSSDDEEVARVLACEGQLGGIQLLVLRSELGEQLEWSPSPVKETQNFGVMHETVKKVGMHCVSFGATVSTSKRPLVMTTDIDTRSAPYITFTFRYRPRDMPLTPSAQGEIDASPTPDRRLSENPSSPELRETQSPARGEGIEAGCLRKQPDDPPPQLARRNDAVKASPAAEFGDDATPPVKDEDDVEDVDALEAQLSAIRQRIDHARAKNAGRSRSRVVKRESSPICVGRFHGGIIDLTDD